MKKDKLWLFVLLPLTGISLTAVLIASSGESPTAPQAENAAPTPSLRPASSTIWQRPPAPDDPTERERRLQNENALLETASEAMSAVLTALGLTEAESSEIRQGFADYRTGCLRIIHEPDAFPSPADTTNPGLPWNAYEHRLQQILGKERAEKFENEYRGQHVSIVKSRRAGIRSAGISAAVKQAAKQ
jgi:hypothetical protein